MMERPTFGKPGSTRQCGLLVSVRNASEAERALSGGADVIDVKEPNRGSLGAADLEAINQIVKVVGGRVPVSVAAGELSDWESGSGLWDSLPAGVDFIKVGLAGWGDRPEWRDRWAQLIERICGSARPAAVVYADWQACQAPPPNEVLDAAVAMSCSAVLVDTFDKTCGNLFSHWNLNELQLFIERVQLSGAAIVLAGSLSGEALRTAAQLRPDLVAVRGALCIGERTGQISQRRVVIVRALLDATT